jgi:hypothetical protein
MENLIKKYVDWLNNKISFRQLGDWFEITTPFLNHHNDYIQIYARKEDSRILISDNGVTIDELEMTGVNIDRSDKRKSELAVILNSFGIKRDEKNGLFINCFENNFPESKHRFIQAILSVYDMYMLAEAKVESFFFEDVMKYFDDNDIRYTPNVQFIGRSNFPHQFDFSIPKTKKYPERLIKLINTPRKDLVISSLFSFEDTRKNRPESTGLIILNDKSAKVSDEIIEAVKQYSIEPIEFSQIFNYKDNLAA